MELPGRGVHALWQQQQQQLTLAGEGWAGAEAGRGWGVVWLVATVCGWAQGVKSVSCLLWPAWIAGAELPE
jgi:hypothetical protein